jgi:ubiquinone biosynthesis protein Coq4
MAIINRQTLHLDFLLAIKGAISLFRDPTQTESVYDIKDGLRNTKATQLALEFVKSDPAVDRIITERYTSHSALHFLRHILVTKTRQFSNTIDRNLPIAYRR